MNPWTSQTVVLDLGWTLVHFLWEGLAIATLLAVVLRMLKNSTAQTRYLTGCAAMMLMALAPLITLLLVAKAYQPVALNSQPQASPWTETTGGMASLSPLAAGAIPVESGANLSRQLEALFPWLVLAWALGVCALSCRLFAGWVQVRRLRTKSAEPMPWTDQFAELAQRLRVSRPVRLLQSALVEVPTVIGWLRPVILLPAGCLIGLTPRQLEAIIAHELAHIRRHDYLVNLLQSAVETLLFYHPAVWWVSRRVREERELCCDDLAVAVCGDRAGYARALATLEELRLAPVQLALAAGGAPLLQRIRRLAGKPERSAGRASWPIAGIALLLVLAVLFGITCERRAMAQTVNPPAAASGGPMPMTTVVPPAGTNSAAFNSTTEVLIKARFVEITKAPGDTNTALNFVAPGGSGSTASATGLLTEPQYQAAINALEQRHDVNVLAMPQAITLSGLRARIQIGDAMTLVLPGHGTNIYETTNVLFGQTLDVRPVLSPDKKSIQVTITPTITEFKGYVLPTNTPAKGPSGRSNVMPVTDMRTTTAIVKILDGQTVVIGGLTTGSTNHVVDQVPLLGRLPLVGGLFRSERSEPVRKELLVFVTATLVNPDGTLYRSDEERKALWAEPPLAPASTN